MVDLLMAHIMVGPHQLFYNLIIIVNFIKDRLNTCPILLLITILITITTIFIPIAYLFACCLFDLFQFQLEQV